MNIIGFLSLVKYIEKCHKYKNDPKVIDIFNHGFLFLGGRLLFLTFVPKLTHDNQIVVCLLVLCFIYSLQRQLKKLQDENIQTIRAICYKNEVLSILELITFTTNLIFFKKK